jgi:hypothetical protein
MLDWLREASDLFAPLSKLAALSKNEALQIAVFSAGNRIHAEIRRWNDEVWDTIFENIDAERLTPFGEVLTPS